ncbi:HAMP domain-containing histidine kinase [Rhodoferax sp. AJA081-3]|uniref:sensor histidine kinase n=1 Tax=Rhodoferax sp. AJA081-3 TaxID=2752316 RepID=UPI001AE0AF41|nr:HAMP domain-containing sensor histidine kinase [Rhodoferax sp. AJA081-3]QTN27241.1 HAMP domain-containing histidine kinase [Rhodoferax sp. AJA081-3]
MQKKIAITLLLIVLLPVAGLAWLGLRMAHNEKQMAAAQVQGLVHAQLQGVDEAIQAYFLDLQDSLLAQLTLRPLDNDSLKKMALESAHVQQVLVMAADGSRVLPAPGAPLSESEKQFMQRTSALWDNPSLLTQGGPLPMAPTTSSLGSSAKKFRLSPVGKGMDKAEAGPAQSGWYAWHWNAQLHHLFWWRDPQNRLIALELAPVTLLSDVITRLPNTGGETSPVQTRTRLVNGSGRTVYEWGPYQPADKERSLAMLPLSHPLASWKLEYFAPALQGGAAVNTFGILAAVLSIGLALAGLALYLYREHQRELRTAQQRVNFVNQVSHELKTPLTNIRMYAELLEAEVADSFADAPVQDGAKAHQYIGVITTESLRLSRLIANVLSLGQSQKSQLRLARQSACVDDVITRCVAAFQPALDAKGIAVQVDAHAAARVMLDPEALEQILNNLVSNVEKYAAAGGAIHISSRQDQDVSTIEVRDFGPGIAPQDHNRIFEPFYRVSSRLTDGVSGTGIGLGIARELAQLHGGNLVVQDVDKGACFQVTLHTPQAKETP